MKKIQSRMGNFAGATVLTRAQLKNVMGGEVESTMKCSAKGESCAGKLKCCSGLSCYGCSDNLHCDNEDPAV